MEVEDGQVCEDGTSALRLEGVGGWRGGRWRMELVRKAGQAEREVAEWSREKVGEGNGVGWRWKVQHGGGSGGRLGAREVEKKMAQGRGIRQQ